MLELENRSMSSSSGLTLLAAVAMTDCVASLSIEPNMLLPPLEVGSSASKSSKFSACCPATTVCKAFSREISSSGLRVS